MHGKRRTNPNGIDIFEFPFNRIRRRKNDNLGSILFFSLLSSSVLDRAGAEGSLFARRCMKLIVIRSKTSEHVVDDSPYHGLVKFGLELYGLNNALLVFLFRNSDDRCERCLLRVDDS